MPSGVYKRSNFCRNGHLKEGYNFFINPLGKKVCRTCYNNNRKISRHNKGISKSYKGISIGIKKYRYKRNNIYHPDWKSIRTIIYKRDKWHCRECGVKCQDAKYKNNKHRIQCHHIDFNSLNNDSKNLITLCASCHMKTIFDKVSWIKYYQSKMEV